jgi:dihydrodipicolinate synthase/N-acetylneuraminate lyase
MAEQFRGVYAIPPTPFTEDDQVDVESLRSCADFCVRAGAHGIVAPVNASEGPFLTDGERRLVFETVVEQTNRRIPVVIGVSGVSTRHTVELAQHAASAGADALMAMPPYVKHPTADEVPAFYEALARATPLPIFIQNYQAPVGTPMSAQLVARLMREIDTISYLKEETQYAPQMMTRVKELAGDALKGMMGGMAGRYLLDEYARGACGTMPACEVTDAHAAVWQALESGNELQAREHFRLLLPLLDYEAMYSVAVYKEVLRRRGVIRTAKVRSPGTPTLDDGNHRELDQILSALSPLLTADQPEPVGR